jgi:NTE family protein
MHMLRNRCRPHVAALTAGVLFGGYGALAQSTDLVPAAEGSPVARPRIGLVLAGGGAKGGAHVGVLKVLEEMHVPVDCIAGTSMGALVGAGYASGIPAAELQKFLTEIDWKSVVGGLGQRDAQPIEQKRAGVTYSNSLELGLKDKRVVVPGGIVNTNGIDDLLRSYVARARMQPSFNRLPIPYRAVATDMITGQMVVLDHGDLATAMRASMAIPGAFAPVVTDQYILTDGGQVRNIPVDVARDLCADVVIVVDLVEPEMTREKLQTATQLLSRSTDVMIRANEALQLQTLTAHDVLISVPMGDIGTVDFERVPETIPLGETAARAVADKLATLALPASEYLAWRQKVTANQEIDARLADVRFEGLERVNPKFLQQKSQVHPGDTVDNTAISREAQRMAAQGDFETVGYQLTGDPNKPTLVWLPKEKRLGPDYLKFDIGMYASEAGDLGFSIYGKHTRKWMNALGGEWRNEVQLGGENLFSTSLYQPLNTAQTVFVEPRVFWARTWEYLYIDGDRLARYRFGDAGGGIDFGLNLGTQAQARVGYLYSRRSLDLDTGSPLLPEGDYKDAGLVASATFDSRDTPFNATRGIVAAAEYERSDDSLGANRSWERAELGLGIAVPVRKDVVWVMVAGGSDLGSTLPIDRSFSLGGPGSFPGYEIGELRTSEYWTASGSYLWKIKDMLSIRGQALYAGLRLVAGQASNRIDQVDEGVIYGGSVYITGRTMVGPLTVGLGATSTDSWSLWLAVGRPIGHGTILEKGIFR